MRGHGGEEPRFRCPAARFVTSTSLLHSLPLMGHAFLVGLPFPNAHLRSDESIRSA